MRFTNREEAGMLLAKRLRPFRDTDAVVLALPRGGVVVGGAVAHALRLPLNVVLVCKLGHPTDPECSAGAVGERGVVVYDAAAVNPLPADWRHKEERRARHILRNRRATYDADSLPQDIRGRTVLLVDDGMATGLCMDAAVLWAREQGAARIVVAVPVASFESVQRLAPSVDQLVVLNNPADFLLAVGAHYRYFPQIVDEEVKTILQEAHYGV